MPGAAGTVAVSCDDRPVDRSEAPVRVRLGSARATDSAIREVRSGGGSGTSSPEVGEMVVRPVPDGAPEIAGDVGRILARDAEPARPLLDAQRHLQGANDRWSSGGASQSSTDRVGGLGAG
jgi:phage baseplate assembly protein gpV